MTRYLSVFCLCLAALCATHPSAAATRVELYQAAVPVADRSDAAQSAAFQAALKTVLIRVTGRRSAEEDPALAPLVAVARRYVQQYRPAPDNQLWVAFDGNAIERWLTQNGQPVWGRERPTTFVWLAVQTGAQSGSIITADDASELKSSIDAAAGLRGLPLQWPSAADVRNHPDYATVTPAAPSAAAELGHRLGAEGVLVGRASNSTAAANVRWALLFQERNSEFSGLEEGIHRTADLYAQLFAASGSLASIDIEVTGITDLHQYASVQTYLESLTFISHVNVLRLSADTVRFGLATRGGAQSLQRALSLNGRLQPIAVGENGIQRFELRR